MNTTSSSVSTTDPTIPTVPEESIADLRGRLDRIRWPEPQAGEATPGFDVQRLRPLVTRWLVDFDWRRVEESMEALGQSFTATADGRRLHALHAAGGDAVPVLLIHGWPDSPLRFIDLIPHLVRAGHTVVAPSIPGFGFSEEPEVEMSRELVAEDFHTLMLELGHSRYAVHGGDWGGAIATTLAAAHPEAVAALHLTDVPFDLAFTIEPETASEVEVAYLQRIREFSDEQVYLMANCVQPDLLALALSDSPVALLGWLAHLYDQWSEEDIAEEHLVANASLLWLTGTVRSSMRLYSEPTGAWDLASWEEEPSGGAWDIGKSVGAESGDGDDSGSWAPTRVEAPTAFALFPKDLAMAPRELAERYFAVERFSIMPRGGHFAALEQPELLATDIVAFLCGKT